MRGAFALLILLMPTTVARADDDGDRERWVAQMGRASQNCVAQFRQKFGTAKGHDYVECLSDQEHKANEHCVGAGSRDEIAKCFTGGSLKVMDACDLTRC